MRRVGFVCAFAIMAVCGPAIAQRVPMVAPSGPAPGPAEYVDAPAWVREPSQSDLASYRPIDAHAPGGARLDCTAQTTGNLIDCQVLEVRPTGVHYEDAAQLVAKRLYRLKPIASDGRPVSGRHVIITVIWK